MAHYARLDENNQVLEVLVVDNDQEEESGEEGIVEWLKENWGGVDWKKTSYNTRGGEHLLGGTPFRKNYAIIGGDYDHDRDAFYYSSPWPSWILNEDNCIWESPIPEPDDFDEKMYQWNESTTSWDEIEEEIEDV
jgi:hypothetical protein